MFQADLWEAEAEVAVVDTPPSFKRDWRRGRSTLTAVTTRWLNRRVVWVQDGWLCLF